MSYPKLTKEQVSDVVAYHAMLTRQSFSPASTELSPKAKRAQDLIVSGVFGCNSAAVASLVSIILDEEIAPSTTTTLLPGSIAVDRGDVVMIAIHNKGGDVRAHYASGISVPTNTRIKDLRAPTDEQIAWFFELRHGLRSDAPPHVGDKDDLDF